METNKVHVVLYFGAERKKSIMSLLNCLFDFGFGYTDFEELFYSDSKAFSCRFCMDIEKAKDLINVLRSLRISCILSDE